MDSKLYKQVKRDKFKFELFVFSLAVITVLILAFNGKI
jgi:hypothetical protein